jgi:glycosyltransferase involved in cell wall biosynthesis
MMQTTMLAVGMLPPPMGGQAMMFKRAVDALGNHYDLKVIDIQFQKNIGESGSFSLRKFAHLFALLFGQIAPLALTKKFDILYYCLAGPSAFGLIKDLIFLSLLRLRARRTVYHFHGAGGVTFLVRRNVFLRAWARLVLFEPDLVLRPNAPSDEAALCKAKRDVIVNNCIEDPIAMIAKSSRKWPDGELHFTYLGVITEDKGVFDVVEIARLLRDRGYRFTVFLVGEGAPKEIARLKELIGRYELGEFVQLTGVLIDKPKFELLQQTTIFLFPTYFRAETQPTVLMEALAVGVPVVASDWRGIGTIIDQGVNGYLVPPRDVEAFSRAIEAILTEGKIDFMRAAARRVYLERFTLDRHIAALLSAFESLDIRSS